MHVSGLHFRDYHLLLDDPAAQVLAMADPVAERVRKPGATTLRSTGEIASLRRIADNDEPRRDNEALVRSLRERHPVCEDNEDVATASLIENWIDQAEGRVWFLFETTRHAR